jgi:AcrR family transcriptional regulator
MPMKTQRKRADLSAAIVEAALSLAIEGGFENVRQREVAARAGVTLRTLYRKFPSKDELLAAGLSRQVDELDRRLAERPTRARSVAGRLMHLFEEMTAVYCDQPSLGRAVVRALVSGSAAAAEPVLAYHGRALALVLEALRGARADGEPTVLENEQAMLLLSVWFAGLVNWLAGGLDAAGILASVEIAIRHVVPSGPTRLRARLSR